MKRLFLLIIAACSFVAIHAQTARQQARRQILGSSYSHPGYSYHSSRSYNAYVYRRRPVVVYRRYPEYDHGRRWHRRHWYWHRGHRYWY